MPSAQVIRIERVQNKKLWKLYMAEYENLTDKYKGNKPEEKFLYYGTNTTDPVKIYKSE